MMLTRRLGILFGLALLVTPATATAGRGKARQHRYLGPHPLSARAEDGYCYINFPHVHRNGPPPKQKALYRDHEGQSVFVADPTPYGYEGNRHSYYGHHPIAVDVVVGEEGQYEADQDLEFCYIDGPHYHVYAPQTGLTFESKGGVYWYIGDFPPAYRAQRDRYVVANKVYATLEFERPVVEVEAPPVGYVGPVIDLHIHGGGPVHGHGHVEGQIGVGVHVDVPTVEVGIGLPGFVVEDGHHHHEHVKVRDHREHREHLKVRDHREHHEGRKRFKRRGRR